MILRQNVEEHERAFVGSHQLTAQEVVLRDKLMDVRGPDDLGPVYSSAQEILKLHDDIGDVVSKTASISLF
jgi:hypothetical protein